MSNAIEVASLFATLSLNDTMTAGLRSAGRESLNFGQRMQRVGASISGFGAGMERAMAPVTDFLRSGVDVAADFEMAMAEIGARTGITGDELARVQEIALQMGADTAFSAQQAADAFLQLLSSGQSLEEAISTLPSVLDAAAASGMDLGTTADGVTDVLAMFGLAVEDLPADVKAAGEQMGITREQMEAWATGRAPELAPMMDQLARATGRTTDELAVLIQQEDAADVIDSLSKAAGASSATMQQLFDGLANVGPVAAQFGLDVDETAAALAVLAENGIKGSEAGTALKSMLLQMAQNTPNATAAWTALGTSLYDAQGNVRDIDTVLDELKVSLGALPVEEQNRLMMDLAGSYGILALNALLGDKGISEMQTAMEDAAGAAKVADARMSGWAGASDQLQGSIETLQIQVLTPFLQDVLTPIVKELTNIVNQVVAWAKENPQLANVIILVAAGAALLLAVMVPLGLAISAAGSAAALLGPLMMGAIGPILLVAAAIGAALAQLNSFITTAQQGAAAAAAAADANGITRDQLWEVSQREAQAQLGGPLGYLVGGLAFNAAQNARTPDTYAGARQAIAADEGTFRFFDWPGRASGGPVSANRPYLVGERGPELFAPSSSGHIIPNHALGGSSIVVNITANGTSEREFADMVLRALRDRGL